MDFNSKLYGLKSIYSNGDVCIDYTVNERVKLKPSPQYVIREYFTIQSRIIKTEERFHKDLGPLLLKKYIYKLIVPVHEDIKGNVYRTPDKYLGLFNNGKWNQILEKI